MVGSVVKKSPDLSVLSENWDPPKLLSREDKIGEARRLIGNSPLVVIGPSGVGKSTLARMAFPGAVIVDCALRRRAQSIAVYIARKLGVVVRRFGEALDAIREVDAGIIVLDDYTLAFRNKDMRLLLQALENHVLVFIVHPSIRHEFVGYSLLEMPPYSATELYEILEFRAVEGRLPVEENALWEIARRVGWPKGPGSARLAIYVLRLCLERASGEVNARFVDHVLGKMFLHVLNPL